MHSIAYGTIAWLFVSTCGTGNSLLTYYITQGTREHQGRQTLTGSPVLGFEYCCEGTEECLRYIQEMGRSEQAECGYGNGIRGIDEMFMTRQVGGTSKREEYKTVR